jgi:hypothetical protein
VLIFHKFVDVLRGASQEVPLHLPPDVTPEQVTRLVNWIIDAEKFDFGDLPLERDPEDTNLFSLPDLTSDEREAWCEGLLPLPAPLCWYEFAISGGRGFMLVRDLGQCHWRMTRMFWPEPGEDLVYDGHEVALIRTSATEADILVSGGPTVHGLSRTRPEWAEMAYNEQPFLALYLTLIINSSSTEVRTECAPERLNRARVKRGRTPLQDHRVVTIVPERYLRQSRLEAGFTRLPPRLHSRRSHLRTLHRGEPNQRRILIPRCWVMVTSEAEVSHEYRIGKQ